MKFLIFIRSFVLTLALSIPLFTINAHAQKIELSDDPQSIEPTQEPVYRDAPVKNQPTGKGAAQKFFNNKSSDSSESSSSSTNSFGGEDHYMMLGLGAFVNSKSYKWGPNAEDSGEFTAGVTYRFGEWVNSMDFLVRMEYQTFDHDVSKDPKKISILPTLIFPDARSGFPLYFGGGLGLGIFFNQLDDESNLSFDYQLFVGGRVLNVFNTVGFFAEMGIKNHIHLLSSGQFDGVFFTAGSVFTF